MRNSFKAEMPYFIKLLNYINTHCNNVTVMKTKTYKTSMFDKNLQGFRTGRYNPISAQEFLKNKIIKLLSLREACGIATTKIVPGFKLGICAPREV